MLNYVPSKMMFFKTYKQCSPSVCCNSINQPNFCSIAKILNPVLKANIPIAFYEEQWRKMPFVKRNDCFGDESKQNLKVFWTNVYCYKDCAGSQLFKELTELVLIILCVPTSNAYMEQVF